MEYRFGGIFWLFPEEISWYVSGVKYCTISTNSSVTGHKAFWSEELVLLSQVTSPSEACDIYFGGFWGQNPSKIGNSEENLVPSRHLMVAEEMLISSWRSQVTSHEELVKMVQYCQWSHMEGYLFTWVQSACSFCGISWWISVWEFGLFIYF